MTQNKADQNQNQPSRSELDSKPDNNLEQTVQLICHRCKNDLATVANLLMLRAGSAPDPKSLAQSMEGRIGALSAVYSQRNGRGVIKLSTLGREIWQRAHSPYGMSPELPGVLPDLELSLRLASPLALWMYEILSNALQHGSAGQARLQVDMQGKWADGRLLLLIKDMGPGLPPDFNPCTDSVGGLKVAQAVARYDLGGSMEFKYARPGLWVTLRIPQAEIKRLNQMSVSKSMNRTP